ncbi:MAG: hypothetical protein K5769_00020 [Pseudobutyrivibrio sp.]|nr:hypothetical protein [Pseudobutyrivibrio sp.]
MDWFTDQEEKGATYEQQRQVIEDVFYKGIIYEYTNKSFGNIQRYDRPTKRGKSRSDAYYASRQQNGARVYIQDGTSG